MKKTKLRKRMRKLASDFDAGIVQHDPSTVRHGLKGRPAEQMARAWAGVMRLLVENGELDREGLRYQLAHPFPTLAQDGDPRIPVVVELLKSPAFAI